MLSQRYLAAYIHGILLKVRALFHRPCPRETGAHSLGHAEHVSPHHDISLLVFSIRFAYFLFACLFLFFWFFLDSRTNPRLLIIPRLQTWVLTQHPDRYTSEISYKY